MKFNKWFIGAVAMAMTTFASCSDNDLSEKDVPNGGNSSSGVVSYLGVSLELPSEPATRGENDKFEDGTAKEYNVDHAAILLFKGAKEADAKFIGAYLLGADRAFDQPNGDQVTVSFQKSIKLLEKPVVNKNEKLWGLAVVNYDENILKIKHDETNSADYGDLVVKTTNGDVDLMRVKEVKEATDKATTFGDFRKFITDSKFITSKGDFFFMTNSPLSSEVGANYDINNNKNSFPGEIQTLAELKDNFEKTETEAIQNPAGCIFVERAVAKITLGEFPKDAEITSTSVTLGEGGVPSYKTTTYTLPITEVEWCLDNEEATSYIVRNAQKLMNPETQYPFWGWMRFIGQVGMNDNKYDSNPVHNKPGDNTWYRTYWCVDPAYDEDKTFPDYTKKPLTFTAIDDLKDLKKVSPLYCHENTFDVKHQNYKNTTRIIFKVTYGAPDPLPEGYTKNDFQMYAVRGQSQTMYLKKDAQNLLKRSVMGSIRLHDLILANLKEGIKTLDYTVDDLNIRFGVAGKTDIDEEKGIKEGDYIITGISFTDDFVNDNFRTLTDEDKSKIATDLAAIAKSASQANHIVPFNNNTCYYAVYLQHFGDTYCALPNGWTGNDVDQVYKVNSDEYTASQRYLGRYGLVRNNWYDLEIGKISNLGSVDVPDGNVETSDDNKSEDWYLSARVHILSWAKRTQKHEF